MGAFYIGTILVLRVVQNYYGKKVSGIFPETAGGRMRYLTLSFGISSAFSALLLFAAWGKMRFDWLTVLLAACSGFALVVAQLCSTLALQSGTMVINSVFGTAGLIVPCICGMLFFQEPMSVWQWLGILVFIGASWLLASSAKDTYSSFSWKTMLLLIGTFLSNGVTMLCQKTLTYVNADADITLFSFFTFAVPAVIFGMLLIPERKKASEKGEAERLNRKIYLPIVLLAVAVFIINQFATSATAYVSSAVLFSLINGGNTIIAAVIAAICFKEKPTARSIAGLVLGLGALMVINIFQG